MTPSGPTAPTPGPVWMKKTWGLSKTRSRRARSRAWAARTTGRTACCSAPRSRPTHVDEVRDKFILGAAYSGLKFGYLWSLGSGLRGGDARGYGKSSLLQHTVESDQRRLRAQFLARGAASTKKTPTRSTLCAVLAAFDMATRRSLARGVLRGHLVRVPLQRRRAPDAGRGPTVASASGSTRTTSSALRRGRARHLRRHRRSDDRTAQSASSSRCCAQGDERAIRSAHQRRSARRKARVGAANYFSTLLLFAKTAGIRHVTPRLRPARGLRRHHHGQAEARPGDRALP